MKTWPIYLNLQNAVAYGPSIGGPSSSSSAITALTVEYLRRISAQRALHGSLVVGPGGPDEIAQLLGVMPPPVYSLTAHEPEALLIQRTLAGKIAESTIGDVHEMPFQSDVFDVVYASNVLEHALAPYAALMQCRRVVRDGGIGIFVLPTFEGAEGGRGPFHLHCLDRDVWIELLRKTGWLLADALYQPGTDGDGGYYHFRCVAGTPPTPHDRILNELKTFHASVR